MSEPSESDKAFQAYLDSGGKLNLLREWVRVEVASAIEAARLAQADFEADVADKLQKPTKQR
jgi:hypothetical protein